MTVIESEQTALGATFVERGDRRVVDHYGRPERAHRAARNAVGLFEPAYGVVVVEGADRRDYVDNVVSNRAPSADGEGCHALVLDPQGGIETQLFVYASGERLLLFVPPERAGPLAEEWAEKVFIQDVEIRVATDEFGVFGLHGPKATEKVASVLNGASSPDGRLTFVRGSMGDAGVSVIRTDAPCGEEGYEVVCAAADAADIFDTLLNHGLNAAPVGYRTWETLTAEAGTPLFETELEGRIPNVVGLRSALDFEKGCYVGQEVVSRVENRGQPSRRLVGLAFDPDAPVPASGAAVFDGDASVGEVTRATTSPTLERPVALALVEFDLPEADPEVPGADPDVRARVDGKEIAAGLAELPFVEGSETSGRLPRYP